MCNTCIVANSYLNSCTQPREMLLHLDNETYLLYVIAAIPIITPTHSTLCYLSSNIWLLSNI